MGKPRSYEGEDITITFDMEKCIHARNCFLKLPQVFDPSRRPWVSPDAASAEEISSMIRTCPSGALSYTRKRAEAEAAPGVNRVAVLENGPLAIHGDLEIGGEAALRATLCRCGLSKNKPYCDYSHVEGEFQATGEPTAKDEAGDGQESGKLKITTIANGPLKLTGPHEITSGTGHRLGVHESSFLCRCGKSENKPYCDGSHTKCGLQAE